MARTLYLIDGHAQIYRSHYAPFPPLTSPSGEPTKAIHVFTQMVLGMLRNRRPDYLAMVMDVSDSTVFRCEIDPQYKANRSPPPEDLPPQIDRIVEILDAMRVPVYRLEGFEADDLMATIVRQLADEDVDIYLVSKDKDLDQLLSDRVHLYDPGKDEVLTANTLVERKGFMPRQAVDVQTLCGDATDNVRGVDGVGPKTAAKLVNQYGSAAAVVEHADELSPKLRDRVKAFAPHLAKTRQVVTLRDDAPITFDLSAAKADRIRPDAAAPIFRTLGMSRMLEQVGAGKGEMGDTAANQEVEEEVAPSTSAQARYELVNSEAAFRKLIKALSGQKRFAFDTETTSLNAIDADLVGLSFCWKAGEAYYVPVRGPFAGTLDERMVLDALRPIMADERMAKVGQNMKYDMLMLAQRDVPVRGELFDTMIASFVLDSTRRSHGLDALALEQFGHHMIPLTDLIGKGRNQITIDQVELERVCEYAAEDADFTWRLYEVFSRQLAGSEFQALFRETEMPLVRVLVEMERTGVALDSSVLVSMGNAMGDRMMSLTKEIHAAAGRPFNVDSPKQLAEVLFDELKLPVIKRTRTARSTDAESLEVLAGQNTHPLPSLILEYRELSKLKGTYVDALPRLVSRRTGRIHCSFHQTGAVTGRLSSSDPNLQNIPIRTEAGRQIRRAFVAGGPDLVMITADYSQVELRILAHLSRDEGMRRAFQEDQDIHRVVAAEVFGLPIDAVDAEHRGRAKAVNFGIVYGQTPFGLSRQTGMSVGEAKAFIEAYFARYPGIRAFIDGVIEQARRDGYVTTMLGRRRTVEEIRSRNPQQAALGERLAVNTVVQGSAADLIKRAMIHIHRRIAEERRRLRMMIQVHDELVFETPQSSLDDDVEMIRKEMSGAFSLNVPLKVDVAWGRNWLEGK